MARWNVQISLDALGEVITWSLSDRGLAELREAIQAGDLGRARIVRAEPLRSELSNVAA